VVLRCFGVCFAEFLEFFVGGWGEGHAGGFGAGEVEALHEGAHVAGHVGGGIAVESRGMSEWL